jgi:hypothetical protein
MADRILRWYVDGSISRSKTQVGGIHKLDADYRPLRVHMNVRLPGVGDTPTEIDILDDGVSIFNTRPAINNNDTEKTWTTMDPNVLREGSIIRMDVIQPSLHTPAHDLTVELELELA